MKTTAILFSPTGRISRRTFWTFWLSLFILGVGSFLAAGMLRESRSDDALTIVLGFVLLIWFLLLFTASLMLPAKRLHDRGLSGLWIWLQLIPVIGIQLRARDVSGWWFFFLLGIPITIWLTVEIGFLRGNAAPNKYGSATDSVVRCPDCGTIIPLSQNSILEGMCGHCQKAVRVLGAPPLETAS